MTILCKDCDASTTKQGAELIESGWEWIDLVNEGTDDPCNGWRCPKCVEGWRIVVEEAAGETQQ